MIAVYTTCYNQYGLIDDFLKAIPEDVDIFITDMGSTDGSYEKLKRTRVKLYEAVFDPFDYAKALAFTAVQIPPKYTHCLNLNLGELIHDDFVHKLQDYVDKHNSDGIMLKIVTFDEQEGHADYLSKEIRLHRNSTKWHWFYGIEPRMFSREDDTVHEYSEIVVGKYEPEIDSNTINAAKESVERHNDGYSKLVYADALYDFGQTSDAMKIYQDIADNHGGEEQQKALCSLSYINSDKGIPNIEYMLRYHALAYDRPESHLEMARIYYKKGWFESCRGYCYSGLRLAQSAIKTDNLTEELGCVWKLLDLTAYCHLKLGNEEPAYQCLTQALNANPSSKRIAQSLQNLHYKMRNITRVIK